MMIEYNLPIMVSLVIGISSTLKKVFNHKYDKYEPLFKLVLGIIAGIVYVSPHNIRKAILDGVLIGLAANGFNGYAKGIKDSYTTLKIKDKNKDKI